jgi:carboxypeptidase PM20D1
MISRTAVFVAALATFSAAAVPLAGSAGAEDLPSSAAARLSEAIRFETISWGEAERLDREAFLGLHALLERSFPRVHASLRREVVNQFSLLYTWTGTDPSQKPILLTDHFDVVPVVEETLGEWEHPPFDGAIADGFVWGRGSLDDKSGVLSILEAVEGLLAEGFAPRRTIYLAIGHDEEVGGDEGAGATAALLRERGIRFEFTLDEGGAVVSDTVPGIERPVALIGIAEKGLREPPRHRPRPGGHSSTCRPQRRSAGSRSRSSASRST